MARAPRPEFYQQGSTPNARPVARAPNVDISSGLSSIGQSLANAGRTLGQAAQTEVEIEQINRRREEDDARVYVAQNMAAVRLRASQMRRDVFTNAEDGWRKATDTVGMQFGEISSTAIEGAPTPAARHFMGLALGEYQAQLLDSTAEEEQRARSAYHVDTLRTSADTNSSVLSADPTQYEPVRAQYLELVGTMSDLSADDRRNAEAYAEEQFALATIGGIVERDPHGALQLLRDPDATEYGVTHLSGPQRNQMEARAQAELNRRESEARARASEARASLRDAVSAQNQLLTQGIIPQQPLDVGQVATLLGPDVAQAYLANLASAGAAQQMSGMPSSQVAAIAAGNPNAGGSDIENLLTHSGQQAAERVLTARRTDPGGYALQNGQMRHPDLIPSLMSIAQAPPGVANWPAFDEMLRDRAADAAELRRRGVTDRVAPLSTSEATALSSWLGQQSAQNRLAFISHAQSAMNRDAYLAMMAQITPENAGPATAFAGYLYGLNTGRATADGRTIARTLLEGQEALTGRPGDTGRSALVDMPEEAELRREWTSRVGVAYEGLPQEAQENAYQAYRAYYAGLARNDGDTSGTLNTDRARRAVAVASGGTVEWNGRETLVPWGMRQPEFERSVNQAFQANPALRGLNASEHSLRPIGGNRYAVYDGEAPLRANGQPVVIQVRR